MSVLTGSKITGSVTLGSNSDSADGADTLTVTGTSSSSKSEITGNITTGAGADTLTLTNATIGVVGQTISLGSDTNALDGNDGLSASGTTINASITTGSGSDTLSLSAGSSVIGNVALGSVGDNQAIIDFPNTVNDSFNSATGWSGGTVDSSNAYYGSFLGRYAAGTKTNEQDVYKSFSLSSSPATISFDFIRLDSWDAESFSAYINNTAAFTRNFSLGQSIGSESGSINGFNWTIAPKDSISNHGFESGWDDQTATITITLPTSYSNFNKLGFGSTLDQPISDESYGIDNLSITQSIVSHDDSLTLDASNITGNVSTGSAADTVTLSNNSTITGSVNLGSSADGQDGNDSLTLTSGSNIVGNVDFGYANDTLTLSTGISSATTLTGDVAFGVGTGDTLSYSGNAGPITVALDGISADAVGTATGLTKASYITGNVTDFEAIVGSDSAAVNGASTSSTTGDSIFDNTGASLFILNGSNTGTIDNLDFSLIENLQLRSESDTLSFQGTALNPGLIAGRADGGGLDSANYTNGVYAGGSYKDDAVDLLSYTSYLGGPVSVDLSKNLATGVYGGAAGGLIDGVAGTIATTTDNSSFENVYGSAANDTITGDSTNNLIRGYGGGDMIDGGAGNDTIDGGDNTNSTDGADVIFGGTGSDTIIGSNGNDTIFGGSQNPNNAWDPLYGVADGSADTLTYADENERILVELTGADKGTAKADDNGIQSPSTYNETTQLVSVSNQSATDWTDTFSDIQNLVLTSQTDIVKIDPTAEWITGTIDGGENLIDDAGTPKDLYMFDVLDYSSFGSSNIVYANLSPIAYTFDFNDNATLDVNLGEIKLSNTSTASRISVSSDAGGSVATGVVSGFGGNSGIVAGTIEGVIGGAADDRLVGDSSANILSGNSGSDYLAGLGGNDTIYGGLGDDRIIAGAGVDNVNPGGGINTIYVTSSDLSEDNFILDRTAINSFELLGTKSGTDLNVTGKAGDWNPGGDNINVLNGGDLQSTGVGNNFYSVNLNGTSSADNWNFSTNALDNIQTVSLGSGNDSVATAPITKGVNVLYDGGANSDNVTLNITFEQFAALNASGLFVADVQNYLDAPTNNTLNSLLLDFRAQNFETAGLSAVTPALFNDLQADPAALTFNTVLGASSITLTSGADFNLADSANATSTATASSSADISSALVQANNIKGTDASSFTAGGSIAGESSANHTAAAAASTADNRTDSVLAAYALGVDRSSFSSGESIDLSLIGTVTASTLASSIGYVATAASTSEAAGSRDSSYTAGSDLSLDFTASSSQATTATNPGGIAIAKLASRTYGIDDAGISEVASTADYVQSGAALNLSASATGTNTLTATAVGNDQLGAFSTIDNGAASTDRIRTSLYGNSFPLITGDRIRFSTTSGGVIADRDYYVVNVLPEANIITAPYYAEFQVATLPGGTPIEITSAVSLSAYRPAEATADSIATAIGVNLDRTGGGTNGVQAGSDLTIDVSATQTVDSSASSVAGDAVAGLNRLGGLGAINVVPISTVAALSSTQVVAGGDAQITLSALENAQLKASSVSADALTEANTQIAASSASPVTAGAALSLDASSNLNLSGLASSTTGAAQSRVGAGAGAGSGSSYTYPAGAGDVAAPVLSTYTAVSGLANGTQTAGTDLNVDAVGSINLDAGASTVSGSRTLELVSSVQDASGSYFSAFNHGLADGDQVQLSAAGSSGLSTGTDYIVRDISFGTLRSVDDRIEWPDFNNDGTPDFVLHDGDTIRFAINQGSGFDVVNSRYGIDLGTTYYVRASTAADFQIATSTDPLTAVVNLTNDDLTGLTDQLNSVTPVFPLIDADRFQLSSTATTPSTSRANPTADSSSDITVLLPSTATAFAGSRERDTTLTAAASLDSASVTGISGNAGLRSLISGAKAAISAVADGIVNAFATNTNSDATASAGLVAEGISDTAILAGSNGTVVAAATINGVASAATTGDSASLDDSLANLNITARGITASNGANDITIGAVGSINASADLSGRSTATAVAGQSDALAVLEATGLQAETSGLNFTISQAGDIRGLASIGAATPLVISATSSADGAATSQASSSAAGILGYDAAGVYTAIQAGASQGIIQGVATSNLSITATGTDGAASATLTSANIAGQSSFVYGIKDADITGASVNGQVLGEALGITFLSASSIGADATASGNTLTKGIFTNDAANTIDINLGGSVAAIAQQHDVAQALTVQGSATSSLTNQALGLGNANVVINDNASIATSAVSYLESIARSVEGSAHA